MKTSKLPQRYRIEIREQLSAAILKQFTGWTAQTDAVCGTVIIGEVRDQSGLHAILNRIQRLNLTLLSLVPISIEENENK